MRNKSTGKYIGFELKYKRMKIHKENSTSYVNIPFTISINIDKHNNVHVLRHNPPHVL